MGRIQATTEITVLAASTRLKGIITGTGAIEIYGHVLGNIDLRGDIYIEASAAVEGKITGDRIAVKGKAQGTITTTETLSLSATSLVQADVTVTQLVVAAGAQYSGSVVMPSDVT